MFRRFHRLLALVLSLGAACASKGQGEQATQDQGPPPARVELGVTRAGSLEVRYPLLGEVRSTLHAELAAGEPGEVRDVRVREGDRVKKGDLLVLIDTSLAKARLHAAAAQRKQVAEQLDQAERDAKRLGQAGKRLVAEREIEQAESQQAQLSARASELGASVQEAQAVLSRLRVVAPFDGQIKTRSVDPGDWVNTGDPVVELVGVDELEVLAQASANLVPRLSEGEHATLRQGDRTTDAEIRGVVRALDDATRTARVRLVPTDGKVPWLLPGGTVDVLFSVEHRAEDGSVIVPRDALVKGAVGTRVVRAVGGKARPVAVEVLATSESEALVRAEATEEGEAQDALAPGQKIVTRGNERLRPGQPLEVLSQGR